MVRGPELKARMTYTAGLSNIREASAPPPPGERPTPAASPASLTDCTGRHCSFEGRLSRMPLAELCRAMHSCPLSLSTQCVLLS